MVDFNSLNTQSDLIVAKKAASSDDGETRHLEFKGCNGNTTFGRDIKKLLANEICAFANTYGGILCFHYGEDDKINPFPDGHCDINFNRLETWLRDSLEPLSRGMELKIVDDVFLIDVPESNNKPHRSRASGHYYYRHGTISQKMPEIMISSMYRSQDFLDFSAKTSVFRTNQQLSIFLNITNQSRIAGTRPRVEVQLHSSTDLRGFKFQPSQHFVLDGSELVTSRNEFYRRKLFPFSRIASNLLFSERVLYPMDDIVVEPCSDPLPRIREVNPLYIVTCTECMFAEGLRQSHFSLVKIDGSESKSLIDVDEQGLSSLVSRFVQLKNEVNAGMAST